MAAETLVLRKVFTDRGLLESAQGLPSILAHTFPQ